jgi:hypothetical protein
MARGGRPEKDEQGTSVCDRGPEFLDPHRKVSAGFVTETLRVEGGHGDVGGICTGKAGWKTGRVEMEVGKESVSALVARAVVGARRTLVDHKELILAALAAGHAVEVRERRRRQRERREGQFLRHAGSCGTGRSAAEDSRCVARRAAATL